ncbi:MAG: hypothetical protein NTX45_11185 [Proteobacteria bacterium]|nr:hypothetical protein [Pseudomonadota bacterium]
MPSSNNDTNKPVANPVTVQAPTTAGEAVHAALGDAALGDDNVNPCLGTTLNSFTDNVSVSNMTGEVSVQIPLVNRPTQQGLGPDLAFSLAYNSTSPGETSQIVSPYLQYVSPYFWYNSDKEWVAGSLEIDWDLDLPAIIVTDVSSTVYTLRFQGQSYQANTNSDDSSSSKTDFYYAKDLENDNKLQLSYTSGSNIKNGVTVITADGTQYSINTKTSQGHYLLTSITKANGNSLSFHYTAPAYSASVLGVTPGSLTVKDTQGTQVVSLAATYTGGNGFDYIPCLYANYSNPSSAANGSAYDIFAQMSLNQNIVSFSSSGSALTASTPYHYAYTNVSVGSTKYYKLSTVTYPTGAYTQFNWLKGGFVVKYGVVHITQAGDTDNDHTFQYSFAPVDTQAYYDYLGNQLWAKQYYYSEDQANGVTSGGDNNGATFQCPNMHYFDTNEMADGVQPTNNWLDPLFHSSDHMHDKTDVENGEGYESGNVSQLINVQTFSVYQITTYPDGVMTKTVNTYDALQRLKSTQVITGNASASAYPVATTTYQYPVNVNQLGEGPNGDLTYHNYGLLPPNFNKPTQVQTTSFSLFNGNPITGEAQTTTTTNQYDAHGNLTSSTVSSGVTTAYTYYQGTKPCGINPYITSVCTKPSTLSSVGILGSLSAAQFVLSSPLAISSNTSYTSYTTMFGGGVILPDTQTSVLNGSFNGPVIRTHTYDSLGRVSSVAESMDCGPCTQTMSYSLDAQGNQTITTVMSYSVGEVGPTLPTTEVVDFLGRTISSTDNLGRTTLYQYDSLGRITQETDLANLPTDQQLVTSYAYEIIPGNASTTGGTRTTVTTPNGAQVIYTFDSVGRQTSNQIKPVNGAQRLVRSFTYATKAADGGPCGNQMTASTTHIADGSSVTVDYYYNALGDLIATVPPAGSPGLAQATINLIAGNYAYALTFNFTYNPGNSGSTTSPITAYGLASLVQKDAMTGATANIYNFDSQALQLGNVSGNSVNAVLSSMNFSAYLLNSDLSVNTAALMTVANSATTTAYSYDTLFRLVDETLIGAGTGKSLTTTRGYDSNGRLTQMQDPKGNLFTLANDPMGNPTQLSVATPGGGNYYLATASYNFAGQKTSYANTPSTTANANINQINYTYDPVTGMPLTETDALGNTIHYLFYPTGLLAAAWSQVETGYYLWTAVQYDKYGSVLSQSNGPIATQPSLTNLTPYPADAIYSYTYNADGQLATKTVLYADQQPCTTTYGYDDCGNMNTYTDPFGQTISASLDPYGRQSAMQATVQGTLLHQLQFAYDSLGRLSTLVKTSHQSFQTPQGVAESFQIQSNRSYSYDHLLRTVGVSDQTSTPNLSNNGLTNFGQNLKYNLWGNVTANNLQFLDQNGSVLGELDQGYTYDQFDRLTGYNVSPSDASFLPGDAKGHKIVAQTFAYDGLDNTQSVMTAYLDGTSTSAPVTTETVSYGYSASLPFQLESVTGYAAMAYDTLGRATTDAYGNSLVYDAAGYISTITQSNGEVISYSYGPDRIPFKETSSDGTSLYTYLTDNNVTARADNTGNTVIKTLIGFGGPTQFTTLDLLGNSVLTKSYQAEYPNLNAQVPTVQESVSLQNVYSPTGIQTNLKAANPSAGYPQNLQPATGKGSPLLVENLTGGGLGLNNEMTDPLTGYQILGGYRAYDPNLGRFNKPDSFAPGIAGLNPYAYTSNQFVGCSDPTGHYTYTYKSYGVAKRSIKRRAAEQDSFWQQVASSYKSVLVNLIKHPTNPSSYVAAAMLAQNPTSPILAAVASQLGQASPVGAVIAGAYAGVQTAVDGVCTMGVVSYNPQTGLGSLNTAGAGNMLGMMSMGYLNMSPNGTVQVHSGHSFLTHLKNEGKGAADMLENIIGGIAGVGIGLCYDMPVDFMKGEYYQAGFAIGMNTALLVSMIAAPEDAPAEAGAVDAEADAASAEEAAAATKARTAAKELEKLPRNKAEAFTQKFISSAADDAKLLKSGGGYAKAVDRTFSGKIGSKAWRMIKAKRFTDYAAEFLGGKIGAGITNLGTYSNLNMTDPRSPWSTAAWQNQLYRQGPYTPDKN